MKNLPEKIYLNLNMTPQEVVETKDKDFHEATKTWEITWSEERLSEHDPEYVRKDAFIEKAINFLEMLGCGFTITDNITKSLYDNIQLIEDFKKYMEE